VSQNGPFAFASSVVYGGGYGVTVQTPPAGQRCTISQGTGTNVTANVTSIQVACIDVYSVGGNVTGLSSGKSLVLHNGAENLSIGGSASGTVPFTFTTPVAVGDSWAVTATNVPPELNCTVTGGSGVMANAPVTNVQVGCVVRTYALSGTVDGLVAGEQVVLQSGTEQLPVNGTSAPSVAFTFAGRVTYGASYSVSLMNAPPTKACSVQNASGQNVVADVTQLHVVCSSTAYSIGGNVTGLGAGKTLALRNGTDLKSVSANGSFTFALLVPQHGSFNVTMDTQPAGQRCTVSGGTSSDVTSNVTSVQVTCADAFSVGGSVSGLNSGSNLVLANGTDTVTVTGTAAASLPFTFGVFKLSGDTYSVTVTTQPSGQTCTVTNGAGTVATGNVTNVSVTCSWFDGFEGGLGNWVSVPGKGTPSLSTAQAHSGTHSYVIDEDLDAIQQTFGSANNKLVSVWFYDNAATTTMQVMAFVDDNVSYRMLGVNTPTSTTKYTYRVGSTQTASTVTRTTGWHELKWDYRSGTKVDMYIDGVLVASPTGLTSFNQITLGDLWSGYPATTAYFDDISISP
jgi:hypothetical protein